MGRKRIEAAERERESRQAQRRRRLLVLVLPLLTVGLASSIYLLHLFVAVRSAGGAEVESFCALSDTLNCVTVANSSYSTFLRLPIALYGLEFFGLTLLGVLASAIGGWRLRAWDSLLFLCTIPALPAAAALAYLSSVRIGSVCLLCAAVQISVLLLFIALLVSGRRQLRGLFLDGPRELLDELRRPAGALGALVLVGAGVSQFFFAPGLFHGSPVTRERSAWQGLPVSGLTVGPADAPLKIEEFTDFQCPHCGHAHQVMMQVLRRFPGKVHLTHRDFPLDMACNPKVRQPFHPNACRAAVYARCAARQDRYWPYEELLFENREQLDEPNLQALASQVGLDRSRLSRCVDDPATLQGVLEDIHLGIRRGLTGTPTLFVNGEKQVGMPAMSWWEAQVAKLSR